IALYPDALVAQVLGAATYPDEVTAADSWLKQNSGLQGQGLMSAADKQQWDPAVKALTQFPSVLDDLAKNLAWTSALGEASATQQQDVMVSIQRMRAKAYAAGNLKSGSQINVVQESPQTIIIQPVNPQVVYVPAYNPTVVYGAPVVVPGYSYSAVAAAAIVSFGVGVAVGAMVHGGCCGWGWGGWGTNWHGNTIVYNRNVYVGNNYWRGGYNGGVRPGYPGYRPGYPAYRPGNPKYRPGSPGYGRPPLPPAGTRPLNSPAREPVYNVPRPTPYTTRQGGVQDVGRGAGQGAAARPVNPAYRPNSSELRMPAAGKPGSMPYAKTPTAQASSAEFRGYQRPQTSGSPSAQPPRQGAFTESSTARAQSTRGNQSLAASRGKNPSTKR
ncbi:MAG TPA: DUF3300 domain-containing protein, partial [Candidatus Acidoferrales bacterium]